MNKEQLMKLFDEKFNWIYEASPIMSENKVDGEYEESELEDIKDFIFGTVIKEVLKSMEIKLSKEDYQEFNEEYNGLLKLPGIGTDDLCSAFYGRYRLKQFRKAKEQFNIDL